MSTFPTARGMAVRSVKAIKSMQVRCTELRADWGDIDYTLQQEFGYLHDRLQLLADEIEEAYPGRGQGGAA